MQKTTHSAQILRLYNICVNGAIIQRYFVADSLICFLRYNGPLDIVVKEKFLNINKLETYNNEIHFCHFPSV